ncbi:NUDIX hydrolase domain protein [Metarhizium album ARSEF 1941]|uniref:NUDIX hydrolase domain protein n=1 Tax=Metarhizium album (strain ARSEF 1941) TaxID=1081103 RepID=A0A0B2X7D9_METAS|nr:NUDIX hydrolase domain protein [Metarhizium album ARSEF 1941]KHO01201.1 NUDIX hydrolase domain protein [Metarhizium album ARSEF 1941]
MEPARDAGRPPRFEVPHDGSLSQFRVPPDGWIRANNKPWDGIATGALVFDARGRVLLLRRARHDSMPGLWEVPGGAVDADDATILHGCARELWEEAGLAARRLVRLVTEGRPGAGAFQEFRNSTGTKLIGKFQFEVEVEVGEGQAVRLDPNEHQDFVWATEGEVARGEARGTKIPFTKASHRDVVLEAFRLRRAAQGAQSLP